MSDITGIKDSFRLSNHKLMNKLAEKLIERIHAINPGLECQYSGKTVTGDEINAVISGRIILADENNKEDLAAKVKVSIASLKNDANLLSMIDK